MTAKEFWEGDCCLAVAFRKADEMTQKAKREKDDFNAWLTGLYVQEAIASYFSKDGKYPDKPHDIFKADKDPEKRMMTSCEKMRRNSGNLQKHLIKEGRQIRAIKQTYCHPYFFI